MSRVLPKSEHDNVQMIHSAAESITVSIPLYSTKVPAGFPSPADDHIEDRLDPTKDLVKQKDATFFVTVSGDSMIEAGIFHGDKLAVDRSIDPKIGDIVIAEYEGYFTVKYLGDKKLIPANPKYSPININDEQNVVIIGVVVGSWRTYK